RDARRGDPLPHPVPGRGRTTVGGGVGRAVVRQRRHPRRTPDRRPADGPADRRPRPDPVDRRLHVVVLVGLVQRVRTIAHVRAARERGRPAMTVHPNYGALEGPVVMIGFGSIGQGTLPLILRHFTVDPAAIVVVAPDEPSGSGPDGILAE